VPGGKGAKSKAAAAAGGKGGSRADAKVQSAGSEALGTDALLQLLKNYARSADIKTAITVGKNRLACAVAVCWMASVVSSATGLIRLGIPTTASTSTSISVTQASWGCQMWAKAP
jgi:hypothetical protein